MINAVILASGVRAGAADQRVLGLGVTERIVRTLLRGGVRRIWLVGEDALLPTELQACVTLMGSEQPETVAEKLADEGGTTLIVPGDVVAHPNFVESLREREIAERRAQVVGSGDHVVVYGRTDSLPVGELLRSPGETSRQLVATRAAERWDTVGAPFVLPVSGPVTRREATWALLRLNWRPHDGIVARLINKHISVRLSARLADTRITPNQMTTVALGFALAGIGLTALGCYWAVVLGAGLVQVQSILDGCDGELARLRFQSSRWGAWYDTVVDDVIGALWVASMGIGMWSESGASPWLYVGLGAACLSTVTIAYLYTVLIRGGAEGHQDFVWWFEEEADSADEGQSEASGVGAWLKYALRRDFYVLLFFLLALLDLLPVMTVLASAGAAAGFAVAMIQLGKRGFELTPKTH